MNQCVPSWDIDDPPPNAHSSFPLHLFHPPTAPLDALGLRTDYEIAELTWENGQLALHGLVPPRPGKLCPKPSPPPAAAAPAWDKHHQLAGGTLESVVNQATGAAALVGAELEDNWFGGIRRSAPSVAIDAVVPCQDEAADSQIGDREGVRRCERMAGVCSSQESAADSLAAGLVESTTLVTLGTCFEEDVGLTVTATTATVTATATNSASPETEKTSLGKRKAISLEDHVSVSDTSSQKQEKDMKTVTEAEKSSTSAKKSRAAAVHNQSERKRRDRINQKMKTLQKLVPNSSKTDKASMLDEVIEYLKQLEAQVQMIRMNNMSMMMPMAMPQLPMPAMVAPMAHMAQLPQLMNLINPMGQWMPPTLPLLHPSAFNPLAAGVWNGYGQPGGGVDPCAVLLARQMIQQQMSLDEYSRMAAVFQQLYQPPSPEANPKN